MWMCTDMSLCECAWVCVCVCVGKEEVCTDMDMNVYSTCVCVCINMNMQQGVLNLTPWTELPMCKNSCMYEHRWTLAYQCSVCMDQVLCGSTQSYFKIIIKVMIRATHLSRLGEASHLHTWTTKNELMLVVLKPWAPPLPLVVHKQADSTLHTLLSIISNEQSTVNHH